MTTQTTVAGPVLDYGRLHHSMWPLTLALIVCTWIGLLWGGVFTVGTATMSAPVSGLLFPVWGLVFGSRGVRKAHARAARESGTQILPDDHWVTQETYRLADRLGLPARPWVATMPVFNAYAIGARPDHAMVVVGTPLLAQLSREEISAVIGHELGHIANNDMRRMALAEHFQKSLTWYLGWNRSVQSLGRWLLSWATELWVLALSRKREYWADAVGAALTSKDAMRSALVQIHRDDAPLSSYEARNARLMVRGKGAWWFSTHPTLEQRLAALDSGSHFDRLPHLAAPAVLQVTAAPAPAANTDRPPVAPGEFAYLREPRKSA